MWIPKWVRDRKKGIETAVPTQVVSNEELVPRPQSTKQKQIEALIGELSEAKAKKLGLDRRSFMSSSMGLATCFMASNMVWGKKVFAVEEAETVEPGAYEDKYPKSDYFIMDVQAHFTNGLAIGFRNMEFVKNMGFKLENKPEAYSFPNFVKEMFFDSETAVLVISGVPGKEEQYGKDGKPLEGPERTPGLPGRVLPSWVMSMRKKDINEMAGSQRAWCQGNCAPNHYWDKATNSQDKKALFEQMDREVKLYGIDSWKWYCHTDPGRSGNGFQLDDEKMTYPFYEKSKELGLKIFSIHKGFSAQSRTLGHLANPKDVEKAALDHPDLTFIIYHSALQHDPYAKEFKESFDPATGDFAWHDVLMKIKERNPKMTNVYPEIGSSFGLLAIENPEMCQHLIGRNVKLYGADHVIWGTDCLWWGSPQWAIDAFKRFQITDEMCEKFGYSKLTKEDKAKIFGLNAAKIYGIDPNEVRKNIPKDELSKLKTAYLEMGGLRENAAYGWVRNDVNV
jgi:predicted TIM-barrel fold metal-dependent hydrolase